MNCFGPFPASPGVPRTDCSICFDVMENPDDCPKMATVILIKARDAGVNPGQNGFQILEPPPKNQQRAQPSQVSEYAHMHRLAWPSSLSRQMPVVAPSASACDLAGISHTTAKSCAVSLMDTGNNSTVYTRPVTSLDRTAIKNRRHRSLRSCDHSLTI